MPNRLAQHSRISRTNHALFILSTPALPEFEAVPTVDLQIKRVAAAVDHGHCPTARNLALAFAGHIPRGVGADGASGQGERENHYQAPHFLRSCMSPRRVRSSSAWRSCTS